MIKKIERTAVVVNLSIENDIRGTFLHILISKRLQNILKIQILKRTVDFCLFSPTRLKLKKSSFLTLFIKFSAIYEHSNEREKNTTKLF